MSDCASAVPISPDPPCLEGAEEPGGVRPVDDAVVVGEREVHHRPDRDRLPHLGVGDDDRALHDGTRAQDGDLRLVDDRRVEQRAAAAGVRQGERATGEFVRADLARARAVGEIGDLAGQSGEVEIARVVDDRYEQPPVGVDGDAQVLGVVVGDRLRLGVDR
jgi:hypothetical protein